MAKEKVDLLPKIFLLKGALALIPQKPNVEEIAVLCKFKGASDVFLQTEAVFVC